MNIDKNLARNTFDEYVDNYNKEDEKIKLKINHTYRVCDLCEQLAAKSGFSKEDTDLAWLLGLLHDIGRFEQLKRYNTFSDAQSIDHALFGCLVLFGDKAVKELKDSLETESDKRLLIAQKSDFFGYAESDGIIRKFLSDNSEDKLILKAIMYHSVFRIPDNLTQREKNFCNMLRDADKIDIIKVNIIVPMEEIYNVSEQELKNSEITKEVLDSFYEEHCVLRKLKKTPVDNIVGHISLMYELVYPESYIIVKEQGDISKLCDFRSDNKDTQEKFKDIKKKILKYIDDKITL